MKHLLAIVAVCVVASACSTALAQDDDTATTSTSTPADTTPAETPPTLEERVVDLEIGLDELTDRANHRRNGLPGIVGNRLSMYLLLDKVNKLEERIETLEADTTWPTSCEFHVKTIHVINDDDELVTRASNDVLDCEGKPETWIDWWDTWVATCDHDWLDAETYDAADYVIDAQFWTDIAHVTETCVDLDHDRTWGNHAGATWGLHADGTWQTLRPASHPTEAS